MNSIASGCQFMSTSQRKANQQRAARMRSASGPKGAWIAGRARLNAAFWDIFDDDGCMECMMKLVKGTRLRRRKSGHKMKFLYSSSLPYHYFLSICPGAAVRRNERLFEHPDRSR